MASWPGFLEKKAKLVTSLFLLRDLLDPIEVLSTGFQKDEFYAHNIEVLISSCIDKIKSNFGGPKIILEGSTQCFFFVLGQFFLYYPGTPGQWPVFILFLHVM